MARATRHTIPPEIVDLEYHLILSRDEAETLQVILRNISGNANTSRRGHADAVFAALSAAGVENINARANGSIRFEEQG